LTAILPVDLATLVDLDHASVARIADKEMTVVECVGERWVAEVVYA